MTHLTRLALAAAIAFGMPMHRSRAEPLPPWAIGEWQAVSLLTDDGILGWGKHGLESIRGMLAGSRLTVSADRIELSRSALFDLVIAERVSARLGQDETAHALQLDHPVMIGQSLPYDPSRLITVARLLIARCGLAQPGAVSLPSLQPVPPEFSDRCDPTGLYRFPDASHIALRSLFGGWVIYQRR